MTMVGAGASSSDDQWARLGKPMVPFLAGVPPGNVGSMGGSMRSVRGVERRASVQLGVSSNPYAMQPLNPGGSGRLVAQGGAPGEMGLPSPTTPMPHSAASSSAAGLWGYDTPSSSPISSASGNGPSSNRQLSPASPFDFSFNVGAMGSNSQHQLQSWMAGGGPAELAAGYQHQWEQLAMANLNGNMLGSPASSPQLQHPHRGPTTPLMTSFSGQQQQFLHSQQQQQQQQQFQPQQHWDGSLDFPSQHQQ